MAKKTAAKPAAKPATPAAPTAAEILNDGAKGAAATAAATPEAKAAPSAQEILQTHRQDTIAQTKLALPAAPKRVNPKAAKKAAVKDVDDAEETDEPELDDDEKASVGDTTGRKPAAKDAAEDRTPAQGKISPELMTRAQEVGLTPAQAKRAGTDEALKAMIEIAEEQLDDDEPPAPRTRRDDSASSSEADDEDDDEPTPPPTPKAPKKPVGDASRKAPEISFDAVAEELELNDGTKEVLGVVAKQVNAVLAAMHEELAEAKGEATAAVTAVRRRESSEVGQQMDECFTKLPEALQDVYGTIPTDDLPAKSPLRKSREKLKRVMASIQMGRQNAGLPLLSIQKLHSRAVADLHEDVVEAEIEKRVTDKLKKTETTKSNQTVLRASGRSSTSGDSYEDRKRAAIEAMDKVLLK